MRYTNVCIWKVENTVDEVKTLLTYNYSKYMRELQNLNIEDSEKKLINKWIPDGNNYT